MASGDIITNIADKETLDACYAILKGLKDTTTSGAVLKSELEYATTDVSHVKSGETFYSGDNLLKTGTAPVVSETTYVVSSEDQVIPAGSYIVGDQTIAAISQSGLVSENIIEGTTIIVASGGKDLFKVEGSVIPNTSTLVGYAICFGWGYGDTPVEWTAVSGSYSKNNNQSLVIENSGTYTIIAEMRTNQYHNECHLSINGVKFLGTDSPTGNEYKKTIKLNAGDVFSGFMKTSGGDGNGSNNATCFIFKGNIFG